MTVKYFEKDVGEESKDLYITWDLNVQLGLICTGEKVIDKLTTMYESLCW